jgi:hypothetical protein
MSRAEELAKELAEAAQRVKSFKTFRATLQGKLTIQ